MSTLGKVSCLLNTAVLCLCLGCSKLSLSTLAKAGTRIAEAAEAVPE